MRKITITALHNNMLDTQYCNLCLTLTCSHRLMAGEARSTAVVAHAARLTPVHNLMLLHNQEFCLQTILKVFLECSSYTAPSCLNLCHQYSLISLILHIRVCLQVFWGYSCVKSDKLPEVTIHWVSNNVIRWCSSLLGG